MNHKFKDNIKQIRKEHNLSQEQLAEELGVSRQAISKWESGIAYPEMDKILSLCEKFNLNIDDLLNKDIKEVKGEEQTKKDLNKYVDDFFKFITDSINLFCNMKLKSKIKCLLEQAIIATILVMIIGFVYGILGSIINGMFYSLLPRTIYYRLYHIVEGLYMLVAMLLAIIIMVKVFKARYLDYYEQILDDNKKNPQETVQKIEIKPNQEKIVIRDSKHSEYRFFNIIYKLLIIGIKMCALWAEVFLCSALFCVAIGIVLSFLALKTGIFFIGLLLSLIMAAIMLFIVILLLFNFIFDRKSDKKKMIWTFIISIILLGIGCGLMLIGALDFDIITEEASRKTESIEINMKEDTFFDYDDIEFIEEERNNIKIEYQIGENNNVSIYENEEGLVHLYVYTTNELEQIRYLIKELNKKHFVEYDYSISKITIYASKENIEKMKKNREDYYNVELRHQEEIENLKKEINEKNELIEEYEVQLQDLLENNNTIEE